MTDVWTSAAVLVGLGLVWWTGADRLDPLIALGMAVNIIWTGFNLVRRSFDGLMDHALPVEEQEQLRAAVTAQLAPGMAFHALRTRRAGAQRFADFHLLVPGAWTVKYAHGIADTVEEAVRAALPDIEVTIHIEPIEEQASWQDSALLPIEQAANNKGTTNREGSMG
jgi:cation diffusion facilitator family transporter